MPTTTPWSAQSWTAAKALAHSGWSSDRNEPRVWEANRHAGFSNSYVTVADSGHCWVIFKFSVTATAGSCSFSPTTEKEEPYSKPRLTTSFVLIGSCKAETFYMSELF